MADDKPGWLKRIGQAILKGVGIASEYIPILQLISPLLPKSAQTVETTVVSEFTVAKGIIATAEQMFTAVNGPDAKTGPDKLKAATPFITALFTQSEAFANHKVKDDVKFTAAMTQLTSALADAWSAVD